MAGDSPLRIFQILRAPVGGLFRQVRDLTEELGRRGHQVGVIADSITSDALTAERLDALKPFAALGIHNLPMPRTLGFADFTPAVWYGFVVPANTPAPVVDRLYNAISKAANDPTVQARLGDLGWRMRIRSGADFGTQMRDESVRWRRVVEQNQIKME